MCLGATSYPTQVAELGLEVIAEAKDAKLSPTATGEPSLASTASESDDEIASTGTFPSDDQASNSGSAVVSSDAVHKSRAPRAACDELFRLQERQRQVMQLLRASSFCSSDGGPSRPISKASVAAVASANETAPRFAELRERYLRCVKSSYEELAPATVPPQAPPPVPARAGAAMSEQGSEGEWDLPVIMAQATANHIAQMGALRQLQEGLARQAEHEAVRARLGAVLEERDALLSQLHELQAAHEALLVGLRAQGEKEAEQPKKHVPAPRRAGLSFAVVAAAAGAAAVLRAMHAGH